ncbi:prepilin-type N-terminal cleavage/methylation domain-containing protein [Oscillatoria laete-virens NRMC-F 0139]|nr:prepilin-type N-terminal cleavage/methylation domain-containing protein [Oscillatoria laete-virens]MDL5053050.1 prepilin-type N-terminal cleavage/methylation domain-containing protein [Oscillatoria laete-virens NRMC-F 0139]
MPLPPSSAQRSEAALKLPTADCQLPTEHSDSCILNPGVSPHRAGFSMIEVSVAIAVMAFGIVAILGLFSLSMGGAKDSVTDSVTSLKAMEILANARTSVFTNSLLDVTNSESVFVNLSDPEVSHQLYYDRDGLSVDDTTRAAYLFVVRTHSLGVDNAGVIEWNPIIDNVITNSLAPSTNMALVQISVIHPALAPPERQMTNFFQSVIVNREAQ